MVEVLCALVILLVILVPLFASLDHYLQKLQRSDIKEIAGFLDEMERQLQNPSGEMLIPRTRSIMVESVRIDGKRYLKVDVPGTSTPLYILE